MGGPWAKEGRKLHISGEISVQKAKKGGKGTNLSHLTVTFCSACPHYNKVSFANEKFPSCTEAMTSRSRLSKDKNPSFPWVGGAGEKKSGNLIPTSLLPQ